MGADANPAQTAGCSSCDSTSSFSECPNMIWSRKRNLATHRTPKPAMLADHHQERGVGVALGDGHEQRWTAAARRR